MKIQHIEIKDFKGIKEAALNTGQLTLVSGGNGEGKSSILDAIKAAFAGGGANLIRRGADKASIFIDLAELKVSRTITEKGNYPKITDDRGMSPSSPQKFLAGLLGVAHPFNPLDFYNEPAREQRAMLLKLVTAELDPEAVEAMCGKRPDIDYEGHGLDVAERLKAYFGAERTAAKAEVKRVEERVTVFKAAVPEGFEERMNEAGGVEDAAIDWGAEQKEAEEKLADIAAEKRAAVAAAQQRGDLEGRLEGAQKVLAEVEETYEGVATVLRDMAPIQELEKREADLLDELTVVQTKLANARAAKKQLDDAKATMEQAETRIAEIEETLGALPAETDTAEDEERWQAVVTEREADLKALEAWEDYRLELAALEETKEAVAAADRQVKFWMKDGPAALLADADLPIKGLSFDGDRVLVDGVDLAERSGSERLLMAVEIFKRLNSGATVKYVPADGLEQLDPPTREAFIAMAEADEEWQYLCTVVTGPEGLPGSVVMRGGEIAGGDTE